MKKNKPLISVIMNCYNGEKFLEKAINDGYDLPEAQRIADYQMTIKYQPA